VIAPSFISSASLSNETLRSISRNQERLLTAQIELSTGRLADAGLVLGAKTGYLVNLRQEHNGLEALFGSNVLAASRLLAAQASMKSIDDVAQSFLSTLLRAQSTTFAPEALQSDAKAALMTVIDRLNTTHNGEYVFSGTNTNVPPLANYSGSPAPSSKVAVDNAFFAEFGLVQTDPDVGSISQSAMSAFLDGALATEFEETGWSNSWSAASNRNIEARISRHELIETSTNANEQAFRKLTRALIMVSDLGFENLNEGARQAIISKAVQSVGEAIGEIAERQSVLGIAQERIAQANEQNTLQRNILTKSISDLESVDSAELSTRISQLTINIETAYTLTRRMFDLSLMRYL
jgi:flagellar hook-associated protein 3 FlgL